MERLTKSQETKNLRKDNSPKDILFNCRNISFFCIMSQFVSKRGMKSLFLNDEWGEKKKQQISRVLESDKKKMKERKGWWVFEAQEGVLHS